MKRLITCLSIMFIFCLAFSQETVEIPHCGGLDNSDEVVIEDADLSVSEKDVVLTFNINVVKEDVYTLFAWVFSPISDSGEFMSYDVKFDGEYVGKLSVTKENWHFEIVNLDEVAVLTSGKHSVSFTGKAPYAPQIEFIKFQKGILSEIPSSKDYDTYYSKIIQSMKDYKADNGFDVDSVDNSKKEITQTSNAYAPPYDYVCEEDLPVKYTYYTSLSFTAGDTVKLSTTGVNSFGHILEFFSSTVPQNYSWVAKSNSSCVTSLNIPIPRTGWYVVRVRSDRNGQSGICNLRINNNLYSYVPLYSRGIRCTQGTSEVYNTFTTHCGGAATLWIEEGNAIPGKITSFNQAYSDNGNFDWFRNSRIRKQYSRPVHAAQVNTLFSYIPESTCDLYIKCKEGDGILPYFPNLTADDAINSAPSTYAYNCIAWAGGIYDSWVWPSSQFSDYYTYPPIAGFDEFYGDSARYPGCAVYTRAGATEDNSVVDLWAMYDSTLQVSYYLTHASVRKGGDSNHHGYDWESKPGSLARTFHPRYALEGDNYGQVCFYYRYASQATRSLQEALIAGLAVIESVEFTQEEQNLVSRKIKEISSDKMMRLNTLYKTWETECINTIHSNPYLLKSETYEELILSLRNVKNRFYYIADKLSSGNELCFLLLEDLSLSDKNIKVLEQIRESNKKNKYDKNGARIMRSIYSNAMNYVKRLLSDELSDNDNPDEGNVLNGFNNVNRIIIDGDDIWAATDNGLVKMNKSTGESLLYVSDAAESGCNDIRDIAIKEGCIYIASNSGGIRKFDYRKGTEEGLPVDDNVETLSFDKFGNLWFSTQHYLNRYDGEKVERYRIGQMVSDFNIVYDMAFDANDVIWLAGVDQCGSGWALSYFNEGKLTAISGIDDGYHVTYGVAIDKDNNKWFAEYSDLVKYDDSLTRYSKSATNMSRLIDVDVDDKNVVWYASVDGGIGCYDGKKFDSYYLSDTALQIKCIAVDDDNIVYLGTTSGIYKYEKGKSVLNLRDYNFTGIKSVSRNATLLATEYYTVDGRIINRMPASGLVIKREHYRDGSIKVKKILIR